MTLETTEYSENENARRDELEDEFTLETHDAGTAVEFNSISTLNEFYKTRGKGKTPKPFVDNEVHEMGNETIGEIAIFVVYAPKEMKDQTQKALDKAMGSLEKLAKKS